MTVKRAFRKEGDFIRKTKEGVPGRGLCPVSDEHSGVLWWLEQRTGGGCGRRKSGRFVSTGGSHTGIGDVTFFPGPGRGQGRIWSTGGALSYWSVRMTLSTAVCGNDWLSNSTRS